MLGTKLVHVEISSAYRIKVLYFWEGFCVYREPWWYHWMTASLVSAFAALVDVSPYLCMLKILHWKIVCITVF